MKSNKLVLIIFLAAILGACTTTKKPTGVWVNKEKIQGKSFDSLFIIVMTADIEARVQLEGDLAAAAVAKGYTAVKSVDIMPSTLKDPRVPTKDEIVAYVKKSGCDAVLGAALLREDESIKYTPGTTAYSIMPGMYYTGSYYGYYSYWQQTVSTSSYYSNDKKYFMLTNLYDAASEEIMWSAQSEVFDPSSLKKFSSAYVSTLLGQLGKEQPFKQ